MRGLYIEHRPKGSGTISEDLVKHMYIRVSQGSVAVVAEHPVSMLAVIRKRWLKIERRLRRERSSTLSASKILELTHQITKMQTIRFTAKPPKEEPGGDVQFATVKDWMAWPPEANCRTLYVTYPITKEQLYLITGWMCESGVIVIYDVV